MVGVLELELELEQFSEIGNILGRAKGDTQPEGRLVIPCSVMGVKYRLRLAGALF
jgi:hypothetical protein